MIFESQEVILKDGQKVMLRSPNEEDSIEMIEHMKKISSQTENVLRYPEEVFISDDEEKDFIKHKRHSPFSLMIVCVIHHKIVGTCHIELNPFLKTRHRAEIAIGIEKDYWNLGLGTILLNELIGIAKRCGVQQIELEVMESNERGIYLYRKMGFETVGYIPNAICLKDGTYLKLYRMIKYLK